MKNFLRNASIFTMAMTTMGITASNALAQQGPGCELRGQVSSSGQQDATVNFSNLGSNTIHIYWISFNGQEGDYNELQQPLKSLRPGEIETFQAKVGFHYSVFDENVQNCLAVVTANDPFNDFQLGSNGQLSGARDQPPTNRDSNSGVVIQPGDQGDFTENSNNQNSAGNIAQEALSKHNELRARHCTPALTWDEQIAATAQAWANQCAMQHSQNRSLGENLAQATSGSRSVGRLIQDWYDEIRDFDFDNGGFAGNTGHFTQVVWRSTSRIGCGIASCNGNDILVCNYASQGNFSGQFRQNVARTCQ